MRFLLIALTFCVLAAMPASAQEFEFEQLLQVVKNDGMSLSEAVESVRGRTKGRIISAETRTKNGKEVHHIKVLSKDGKVKTHKVQGRSRDKG